MEFVDFFELKEFVLFCETINEVMKSPANVYLSPEAIRKELESMGKSKTKHSLRVGDSVLKMGADPHTTNAAYFHDYGERVGDPHNLPVSPLAKQIINMLTAEGDPLEHMKQVLSDPSLDKEVINSVILVKIADRLDNLYRRLSEKGEIPRKYIKKSKALLKYLFSLYTGDEKHALWLKKRLEKLGVLIKKKWFYGSTG